MMLYFSAKALSLRGEYYITDENNRAKYNILGNSAFHFDLYVYDRSNAEVAHIREKTWTIKPVYYITAGDNETFEMVGSLKLRTRFDIKELGWVIAADKFIAHKYYIMQGDHVIACVHNHNFSVHSKKEIEIFDEAEELNVICTVLGLAIHEARASSSACT